MSEVASYRAQILAVDEQLAITEDAAERAELQQVRQDLEELIELLESEETEDVVKQEVDDSDSSQPGPSDSNAEEIEDTDLQDYDDLVGNRCMAPFPRAQLPLSNHAAIILQVDLPKEAGELPMARLLYSHPLITLVKPCQHFLTGSCKFEDNCRFSHGEAVPLHLIEEYKEPDFSKFSNGSLVLCCLDGGLWELGRVTDREENELALRLLKSGKEVSTTLEKIVPIEEDEIHEEKEALPTTSFQLDLDVSSTDTQQHQQWAELKGLVNGRVTVGELGNWSGGGLGLKLMQKMGYKLGEGLGKRSQGIVHAIQAEVLPKNKSLDEIMSRKRKHLVDGKEDEKKKRLKKALESSNNNQVEHDIFAFLNKKLNTTDAKIEKESREKKDRDEIKDSSNKSLGIKRVTLDKELKDLKTKRTRLMQGIERNKNDRETVRNIQTSLEHVNREIQRVESLNAHAQSEVSDRHSKKKSIF